LPVVAETFDGRLNDTFGQHVKPEHVIRALDGARGGAVEEGSVGGGTGMVAFGFKAGIGTSSRRLVIGGRTYTVGVLVQANFGAHDQLIIAGVPIGRQLTSTSPTSAPAADSAASPLAIDSASTAPAKEGSIVVIVATDAPLLPSQMRRVALRATHGMARVGGMSGATSGDLFLAFTTARPEKLDEALVQTRYIDSFALNPLFSSTVFATEEAIVNSLFAGRTMRGINGHEVEGLPVERVRSLLRASGRLREP